MTDTREERLAQRAEIDAKLAALDAEPDWICFGIPDEVIEAGIAAWDKAKHDLENYVSGVTPDWDEGMIVCAIYKAMAPRADALEVLRAERDDYEQLSRAASGEADVLRARIAQLETELAGAREAALEEAARALACRNRALDRRRVRALAEPRT